MPQTLNTETGSLRGSARERLKYAVARREESGREYYGNDYLIWKERMEAESAKEGACIAHITAIRGMRSRGVPASEIAEIIGWDEERVQQIQ